MQPRFHTLLGLLALLWESGRREMLTLLAFSVAGGLGPLAAVLLLQGLIDSATAMLAGRSPLWHTGAWLGALLVANAVAGLARLLGEGRDEELQERLKLRVQERLLAKASRLPLADFELPARYDQLHQAQRSLDTRLLVTLQTLFPIPALATTVLSLALFFGAAHPLLPLLLVAGVLPGAVLEARYAARAYRWERASSTPERLHHAVRGLLVERPAAAEVRLFGLQAHLHGYQRRLWAGLREKRVGVRRQYALIGALRTALTVAALGGALAIVVLLVGAGRLSLGAVAANLAALQRFADALSGLFYALVATGGDLRYVADLLAYLDLPEEQLGAAPTAGAAPRVPPVVRFEGVSFAYPGGERPVLHNLSFTIAPGERVALVGENGAGKTTLARLLLGLYAPSAGRILVDGRALDASWMAEWRGRVAAVFQDYVRYAASARENIAFGDGRRAYSEAAIAAAATASGADALIATLPAGDATPLGREYDEQGQDLSGGQWQKLALARAYLRDAPLVVLDEPTAALDARAEVEVYRQFRDVAQGRSVVLISHRLGSARLADRILVLEGGQIMEEGNHEQLLAAGGLYASMYLIQSAWYI